jgi:hypothetical protein
MSYMDYTPNVECHYSETKYDNNVMNRQTYG